MLRHISPVCVCLSLITSIIEWWCRLLRAKWSKKFRFRPKKYLSSLNIGQPMIIMQLLKCPLTFMAMASHPQRNGGKHEQRNTMSKLANTLHLWYQPKVAIEGMRWNGCSGRHGCLKFFETRLGASWYIEESNKIRFLEVRAQILALECLKVKLPQYRHTVAPTHFQKWVGEPG